VRLPGGLPCTLRMQGAAAVLAQPLVGFFCSQECPGGLASRAYDLGQHWRAQSQSVVSGFHSPVEQQVYDLLLKSPVPICQVLARGLPRRLPPEIQRPLAEQRLLLASPFPEDMDRVTRETAAIRNQVVAELAQQLVVAYAHPESRTEALCHELARTGKPCFTLDDPRTGNLQALGFKPLAGV